MINRRLFLQTSTAAVLIAPTTLSAAVPTHKLDLWEAKIITILHMAKDYNFTEAETKGLFGYPAYNTWSREELGNKMLEPSARGCHDTQVRVENILAVHTWIRGRSGSSVETQRYELDMPRAHFYHPTMIADGSLGSLLRTREYCFIALAADWCRLRMTT